VGRGGGVLAGVGRADEATCRGAAGLAIGRRRSRARAVAWRGPAGGAWRSSCGSARLHGAGAVSGNAGEGSDPASGEGLGVGRDQTSARRNVFCAGCIRFRIRPVSRFRRPNGTNPAPSTNQPTHGADHEQLQIRRPRRCHPGRLCRPDAAVTGNINARGTVNGAITQIGGGALSFFNGASSNRFQVGADGSALGGQHARVGGVAGAVTANRIDANGTVNGAITQVRLGVADGGNEQLAAVGSVSNTTANNIRVTGTATGAITQVGATVAAGANVQALQIGSVTEVEANNINATGTLVGASTQISADALAGLNEQVALIGAARRVEANNLTLNGTLRGNLLQVAVNADGFLNQQVTNVGGVHATRARNITTNGTVNGAVTQISANVGAAANVQSAVVGGVQGADVSGNEPR